MTDKAKEAGLRGGLARETIADGSTLVNETIPVLDDRTPVERPTRRRGALSVHTRDRIASQLRSMYDTVAQQPVPDRFAELIARLDSTERKSS